MLLGVMASPFLRGYFRWDELLVFNDRGLKYFIGAIDWVKGGRGE
jgi:hypothetical protein